MSARVLFDMSQELVAQARSLAALRPARCGLAVWGAACSLLVLLAAGCSGARPPPGPRAGPSVSDAELGLSKGSVFEVPTPPAVKRNQSAPGELPVLPRMYAIAPPRIPHGVDDFVPITRDQNLCLGCHGVKEKKPGEPTPIPASHYVDLRRAPETPRKEIAGTRWVCVSCHMPRTEAEPLAGSSAERPR